jgi:DNA replication and repair protein RecF
MKITGIELENFRNYKNLSLLFDSDVSVLYGPNGQGKTNILEAIYLCSCLRSHRTSRDSDMVIHGEEEYRVSLDYIDNPADQKASFTENVSVSYREADLSDPLRLRSRRTMFHNEMSVSRMSDIIGKFHAVIFAPEDLSIIKEGPSVRRRFLDMMISQIRVSYFKNLGTYQKILLQRNALLKQIREGSVKRDYAQMEIWDISLAGIAAGIISARFEFTEKITKIASACHKSLSYEKEEISVKYKTITGITINNTKEEIKDCILKKLKTNFYEDIDRGNTNYGPHRDDLEIVINGEMIRSFASQGQQRTAVLALKISELEIIREETGNYPVLLLDDVMSELDKKRRKALLQSIGDAQVLLTCTDRTHIADEFIRRDPTKTIRYYRVNEGDVTDTQNRKRMV